MAHKHFVLFIHMLVVEDKIFIIMGYQAGYIQQASHKGTQP